MEILMFILSLFNQSSHREYVFIDLFIEQVDWITKKSILCQRILIDEWFNSDTMNVTISIDLCPQVYAF